MWPGCTDSFFLGTEQCHDGRIAFMKRIQDVFCVTSLHDVLGPDYIQKAKQNILKEPFVIFLVCSLNGYVVFYKIQKEKKEKIRNWRKRKWDAVVI